MRPRSRQAPRAGGTLVNAAEALLTRGAKEVNARITHGVQAGGAVVRIARTSREESVSSLFE